MCTLQSPDREPFVYILKHQGSGKRYCGVKFSKGCKPSDLLTTYFTSSKVVKRMMDEGEVFLIEKVIPCTDKNEAIELEEFILIEANAPLSDDWFNLSVGRAINPEAVRATCLEKYGVDNWVQSVEGLQWAKDRMIGNQYTKGQKRSDETKHKMSIAFTGRVFSDEHREKIRQNRLGSKASDETKKKLSESRTRGKHPRATPINTPDGVFECLNDAADFYKITGKGIARRISSNNFPEYYKLNKEQQ